MLYRKDLDALKGFAIVAVVLYHMGIMPNGYLGVDVFFVINGFFILPRLCEQLETNAFNYFAFLKKRLIRLMPLVIIATTVTLLVGSLGMMPDDYENLAQSVFATNICANNVLAAITTKNYWDVANEYKPLMHTWYLGILVQFYVLFPLLLKVMMAGGKKLKINLRKTNIAVIILVTILSLIGYLLPSFPYFMKFYYIPFRLFELCMGGLLGMLMGGYKIDARFAYLRPVVWIMLLLCMFYPVHDLDSLNYIIPIGATAKDFTKESSQLLFSNVAYLVIVVCLTTILLVESKREGWVDQILGHKIAQTIGKLSFSLFIWHQVILAFWRYYFSSEVTPLFILLFFGAVSVVSYVSYRFVEQVRLNKAGLWSYMVLYAVVSILSLFIYKRAGVIRDVPELGISYENPYASRNTEYTDKIYQLDKDYTSSDKIKVLVVGNSFARDFACVLLESEYADRIELT